MQDFLQPANRPVEAACNRSERWFEDRDEPVDPAIDGSCNCIASGKRRCHKRRQMFRHDDGCDAERQQKGKSSAPDSVE